MPKRTIGSTSIYDLVGETIVMADEDRGVIVTWNDSVTLNSYGVHEDGSLTASDTCTIDRPSSQREAMDAAEEWLNEDDSADEDDEDDDSADD